MQKRGLGVSAGSWAAPPAGGAEAARRTWPGVGPAVWVALGALRGQLKSSRGGPTHPHKDTRWTRYNLQKRQWGVTEEADLQLRPRELASLVTGSPTRGQGSMLAEAKRRQSAGMSLASRCTGTWRWQARR